MSRTHPRAPWQLRALLGLAAATALGDKDEVTSASRGWLHSEATAFGERAAPGNARRTSGLGEQADANYLDQEARALAAGSAREPASHTAGHTGEPWLDIPGQFLPNRVNPVLAAADVALAPVRLAGAYAADEFPEGISPLPVTAFSGGPCRPHRLVHCDGTVLDCRPIGRGPVWTGIAAGVVPATDDLAPGWLQVVFRDGDDLLAVHPALLSPWTVDPYACIPYRQRVRFTAFDAAEAAGLDAAGLPAILVDPGDRVRAQHPCGGGPEIRKVLDVHSTGGATVMIASAGLRGSTTIQDCSARRAVDVMIPHRHPGENGPQALCLFARPEVVGS
jgi:hypothetical protein